MPTTVVVAHAQEIVRYAVRSVLDAEKGIDVVAEAGSGEETLRFVKQLKPDIVVLDVELRGGTGLETLETIVRRGTSTRAVVLTARGEEEYIRAMLRRGAAAYVLVDDGIEDIVNAVRHVAAGNRYVSPSVAERLVTAIVEESTFLSNTEQGRLTEREREVARLAASGNTNQEIAEMLFISRRTVEAHRARAMHKLGISNPCELVRYAIREGLIPAE